MSVESGRREMLLKSAPQVSTVGLTVVLHYSVARISEMKNMFCTVFGLKQTFFSYSFMEEATI